MKPLSQIHLAQAEKHFAVANTPLFLLRKLLADSLASGIGQSYASEDILKELKFSLQREPQSISDAVRPYVYLVALFRTNDHRALREACASPAPHHAWYADICHRLLDAPTATTVAAIKAQPKLVLPGSKDFAATSASFTKLSGR